MQPGREVSKLTFSALLRMYAAEAMQLEEPMQLEKLKLEAYLFHSHMVDPMQLGSESIPRSADCQCACEQPRGGPRGAGEIQW